MNLFISLQVCPGFPNRDIFKVCPWIATPPSESQSPCSFCQKDFVNFQLLFFHCWKLTVRPGLKAVVAFFSNALTLIAKNDLKEWLIPRGGCWHKSALLRLMQVLSEGMLQLYCCGNLVTLTTPDIKSSKSITTQPGLEFMSNELVTNKCSELFFLKNFIMCCNTPKKKTPLHANRTEWVTFWWFLFLGSLKHVLGPIWGEGCAVRARSDRVKLASKICRSRVCLQRVLKQNNMFWSKCLWGQSLTWLKEWLYGSLAYINQLIKSRFNAPTWQTK